MSVHYKVSCDQCGNDITDNNYDAKIDDNSINRHLQFCNMGCLVGWVYKSYPANTPIGTTLKIKVPA